LADDGPDENWDLVLADVAQLAAEQLNDCDRKAWNRACDDGRGPDADVDIAGWRTVARESDYDDE
jgi:hypothetical protein